MLHYQTINSSYESLQPWAYYQSITMKRLTSFNPKTLYNHSIFTISYIIMIIGKPVQQMTIKTIRLKFVKTQPV